MSIGEVAARLRAAIELLQPDPLYRAIECLESARTMILAATEGSSAPEPAEAVALLTQAIEEGERAIELLLTAIRHIEAYPEFAAEGGGSVGVAVAGGPGDPASGTRTPGVSGPPRPVRRQVDLALVDELRQAGHWVEPAEIVRIGRTREGRVVWLEDGSDTGGFLHIMDPDRVTDFRNKGVAQSDIVDVVFTALATGEPIGITGRNRVVYAISHQGRPLRVAISVGPNGYIIGANPVDLTRKIKPLR